MLRPSHHKSSRVLEGIYPKGYGRLTDCSNPTNRQRLLYVNLSKSCGWTMQNRILQYAGELDRKRFGAELYSSRCNVPVSQKGVAWLGST